jgi:hypothetical protein
MEIPPEVAIRATIRLGSVYYFPEETFHSSESHYFIVINNNPYEDSIIFLVCSSSQIEKTRRRRMNCPDETLVEIAPEQYGGFKTRSIVDCNYVIEKSIEQLIEKLSIGELKLKEEMDVAIVHRLRNGVLNSRIVENRIKTLLKD